MCVQHLPWTWSLIASETFSHHTSWHNVTLFTLFTDRCINILVKRDLKPYQCFSFVSSRLAATLTTFSDKVTSKWQSCCLKIYSLVLCKAFVAFQLFSHQISFSRILSTPCFLPHHDSFLAVFPFVIQFVPVQLSDEFGVLSSRRYTKRFVQHQHVNNIRNGRMLNFHNLRLFRSQKFSASIIFMRWTGCELQVWTSSPLSLRCGFRLHWRFQHRLAFHEIRVNLIICLKSCNIAAKSINSSQRKTFNGIF